MNTWVEAGLINGAQGIVKDLFFEEAEIGDSLPSYVLVEMDDYKGPRLFSERGKEIRKKFKRYILNSSLDHKEYRPTMILTNFPIVHHFSIDFE